MTENPLVSVIIPVYNGEKYLESAIDSVISQTYQHWELILVDDGSTDQTPNIIDYYLSKEQRIEKIVIDKPSGGPAKPRNLGMSKAKGRFIAFLDADDKWISDKLHRQIKILSTKNIDMVCGGAFIVDAKGNKTGAVLNHYKKVKWYKRFMAFDLLLLMYNPVILSSVIIKNKTDLKFRQDKRFSAIEDWVFWIEHFSMGERVTYMDDNLVFYRQHESSLSTLNGSSHRRKAFYLYGTLIVEKKLSLIKFIFLTNVRFIRVIFLHVINGLKTFKSDK